MTSAAEFTVTVTVTLKSPKDWTRWLTLIKMKALHNDLWQHINPSAPSPPKLVPLIRPLPTLFVPAGTENVSVITLTAAQFQRYNAGMIAWQEELKDHKKKVKIMIKIEDHVI